MCLIPSVLHVLVSTISLSRLPIFLYALTKTKLDFLLNLLHYSHFCSSFSLGCPFSIIYIYQKFNQTGTAVSHREKNPVPDLIFCPK